MDRSIEQALLSLLPTLNGALPAQLVQLASSLLAQSRHRASALKTEEEIARLHACAHIACDRLKIPLNLPPIESRPPIPPRIYKRLYNHLDKILPATSTPGRGTPHTKRRELDGSPAGRAVPSRSTPSKEASLAPFRNASASRTGTPSKLGRTGRRLTSTGRDQLPAWTRPTLRYLCKEFEDVRIGPTVIAAMEEIVVPHGKETDDEWVKNNLVPLLGALFMYVWRCVSMPPEDLDERRYARARKQIVEALKRARTSVTDVEGSGAWEGWRDIKAENLDSTALWISRHGWLESDWAKGIEDIARHSETSEDRAPREATGVQVRRPDTMTQDRFDFLSTRRKHDYATWEGEILRRIEKLEQTRNDTMDTDP